MMRLILLLMILTGGGQLFSQSREGVGCAQLLSATRAICGKDTAGAISLLDQLNRSYPDTALNAQGYLVAGRIYLAGNRRQDARYCFEMGLRVSGKLHCRYTTNEVCPFSAHYFPFESKSAICIELSKMAEEEGKPALALSIMLLTDSVYFPFTGCGNGDITQQGYLSTYVAHAYLINGDTAKAMNRLLNNVLKYHTVTPALLPLLQKKFTRSYINNEIMEAVSRLKPLDEYRQTLNLFEQDVVWEKTGDEFLHLRLMGLYQWPEQVSQIENCEFYSQLLETLRKKDTVAAGKLLDNFISHAGDSSLATDASLRAGQVYYALQRPADAKRVLQSGINSSWKLYCRNTDIEAASPYVTRAGMYQLLHTIAKDENELPLALHYLLKADEEYINYKEAGPAISFYRGHLSTPLIRLYLQMSDTSNAIRRGMEQMMNLYTEVYTVRDLLLANHTSKQIDTEFRRAINAIRLEGNIAYTRVFGYPVAWKLNNKKTGKAKEELRNHYRVESFLLPPK